MSEQPTHPATIAPVKHGVQLPAGAVDPANYVGDPAGGDFIDWGSEYMAKGIGPIAESDKDGNPTMLFGQPTGVGKAPVPQAAPAPAPQQGSQQGSQGAPQQAPMPQPQPAAAGFSRPVPFAAQLAPIIAQTHGGAPAPAPAPMAKAQEHVPQQPHAKMDAGPKGAGYGGQAYTYGVDDKPAKEDEEEPEEDTEKAIQDFDTMMKGLLDVVREPLVKAGGGHKYKKKIPDGKGGHRYIYDDPKDGDRAVQQGRAERTEKMTSVARSLLDSGWSPEATKTGIKKQYGIDDTQATVVMVLAKERAPGGGTDAARGAAQTANKGEKKQTKKDAKKAALSNAKEQVTALLSNGKTPIPQEIRSHVAKQGGNFGDMAAVAATHYHAVLEAVQAKGARGDAAVAKDYRNRVASMAGVPDVFREPDQVIDLVDNLDNDGIVAGAYNPKTKRSTYKINTGTEKSMDAFAGLETLLKGGGGHKYTKKIPDGKGGHRYIYDDPKGGGQGQDSSGESKASSSHGPMAQALGGLVDQAKEGGSIAGFVQRGRSAIGTAFNQMQHQPDHIQIPFLRMAKQTVTKLRDSYKQGTSEAPVVAELTGHLGRAITEMEDRRKRGAPSPTPQKPKAKPRRRKKAPPKAPEGQGDLFKSGTTDMHGRALRKGLHAFRSDASTPDLPPQYMYDYLVHFVEEACEHECREQEHQNVAAQDKLRVVARGVMGELLQAMLRDRNLKRAVDQFSPNVDTICRILTSHGIFQGMTHDGWEKDEASHNAMGVTESFAYSLDHAMPAVDPLGRPGVARVEQQIENVAHLVKSDVGDPHQLFAAHGRAQARALWGHEAPAAASTVDHRCPVHGGLDLTKAQNLWNPMQPCTCSGTPRAYG
jgi:hypothetical protein